MAIKMDYETLIGYSGKLNTDAANAVSLASSIKQNVQAALSTWEGASKDKFSADFDSVLPTLEKTVPELLATLAQNMKTMADNIHNADLANGG